MAKKGGFQTYFSQVSNLSGQKQKANAGGPFAVQNVQESTTKSQQDANKAVTNKTENISKGVGSLAVDTTNLQTATKAVKEGPVFKDNTSMENINQNASLKDAAAGNINQAVASTQANLNQAVSGASNIVDQNKQQSYDGQVGQQSDLQAQSADINQALGNMDPTSNVGALGALYRFYDPRFASVDSNVLASEIDKARGTAQQNVEASDAAERNRQLAMQQYLSQAGSAQQRVDEFRNAQEAEIKRLQGEAEGSLSKYDYDKAAAISGLQNRKANEYISTLTDYKGTTEGLRGLYKDMDQAIAGGTFTQAQADEIKNTKIAPAIDKMLSKNAYYAKLKQLASSDPRAAELYNKMLSESTANFDTLDKYQNRVPTDIMTYLKLQEPAAPAKKEPTAGDRRNVSAPQAPTLEQKQLAAGKTLMDFYREEDRRDNYNKRTEKSKTDLNRRSGV